MTYFINRVGFDDLKTTVRIFKARGLTREQVLNLFSGEKERRFTIEQYEGLDPISVSEALAFSNAQQRMAALTAFTPEQIAARMNARLLHRAVIPKKLTAWDERRNPVPHEYEDVYELYTYHIEAENQDLHVYYVKCRCPSTGRDYFLYVPPDVGRKEDAVSAVAWTMRVNWAPLTADEYRELMYAEA